MKALVVIDLQYDFMPGGTLGIPEGDRIAPVVESIRDKFDLTVFTQDWHPCNHCSFSENGGIWPVHCVQHSHGAEIDTRALRDRDIIVKKGEKPEVDSYSGFWDNNRKNATELDTILKKNTIDTVYVCGLATEYCVKFTTLDALDAGYQVFLIVDLCRGVDAHPGDVESALQSMKQRGCTFTSSETIRNW